MQRCAAIVLPSRYEPFGIVALEAAATGIPLVVSTAGGLGEAVDDGVTGFTFEPADVALRPVADLGITSIAVHGWHDTHARLDELLSAAD